MVVPTRDRIALVRQAVRSALREGSADIEVIVVDDGSVQSVSGQLGETGDGRLRVERHQVPRGRSAARNTGISLARGRWVAFLDDDDVWAPDKLSHQLAEAARTGAAWAYAGDVVVDEQLSILAGHPPLSPGDAMASLGRYNTIPAGASNVIVRRDLLEAVGGFDADLHRAEDWDLWLRLARHGTPAVVRRPLVGYRMRFGHGEVDAARIIAEPDLLAARHAIEVDRQAVRRRAGWTCLLANQRGSAARHYLHAAARGDLRSFARAAIALAHPSGSAPALFRRFVPRDATWEAEAQAWLTDLKASLAAEHTP